MINVCVCDCHTFGVSDPNHPSHNGKLKTFEEHNSSPKTGRELPDKVWSVGIARRQPGLT